MADYYPLISKAVAGLDPDAPGESRRALYERARAALRTINTPLTEAEITRERLALEEAVRRVEGEAAQRADDAGVPSLRDRVEISVEMPSMIVTGGATGRVSWIWRWIGIFLAEPQSYHAASRAYNRSRPPP
jgi:hypothetical protein